MSINPVASTRKVAARKGSSTISLAHNDAAVIFRADGSFSGSIPKSDSYDMESPAIKAVLVAALFSEKQSDVLSLLKARVFDAAAAAEEE